MNLYKTYKVVWYKFYQFRVIIIWRYSVSLTEIKKNEIYKCPKGTFTLTPIVFFLVVDPYKGLLWFSYLNFELQISYILL